jgi:protein-S-isoprenylcysteine O-methyltransferase Ste14
MSNCGTLMDRCWTNRRFVSVMRTLRRHRTLSLKIAFPVLIVKDILLHNKPHELEIGSELSSHAGAGGAFIIIGVLIRLWARGHFEKGRLFTTGPYSVIRHPLYFGSFMILIGTLLQLNSWLNWFVALPLFVFFHGIAIAYEERSAAEQFGAEWVAYASATPALIPSVRSIFSRLGSEQWQLRRLIRTGEYISAMLSLSIPVLIEATENIVFERIPKV